MTDEETLRIKLSNHSEILLHCMEQGLEIKYSFASPTAIDVTIKDVNDNIYKRETVTTAFLHDGRVYSCAWEEPLRLSTIKAIFEITQHR